MPPAVADATSWHHLPEVKGLDVENLCANIKNLHPTIAALLIQRGYDDVNSVRNFFTPTLDCIDALGKMKGLEIAAKALVQAIEAKRRIHLYGDYDVDGTCSVASMFLFIQSLGGNVSYYIPDRYGEGYGVSRKGVDVAIENRIDLFVTLDCGINAVTELNRATRAGIDVIICDHHLPGKNLPEVLAILNPQQLDCPFLGKELCGCGVGLMLIREVAALCNVPALWKQYLDLAAIATCCDIVPLKGINRWLVAQGIIELNIQKRPGIDALLTTAAYEGFLDVGDIVFKIGPRINAAGRLKHADMAVKLLTESDEKKALELASEIEHLNTLRKTMDRQVAIEALDQLHVLDPNYENSSTIVCNEKWHKGIIGIVASRLIEHCYRPTIVLTEKDGMLTGSARSVDGFNLYEAIDSCAEYLERFGGHAAAAGLTLKKENLEDFRFAFEQSVRNQISQTSRTRQLKIDLHLDFSEWYNPKYRRFVKQLNRLRPFGPYNMTPLFETANCKARLVKVVGNDHLKFQVSQDHDAQRKLEVIAFGQANLFDTLNDGHPFNLVYTIGENIWNEQRSVQLEAKGIALKY